jgi:hypothetical protein
MVYTREYTTLILGYLCHTLCLLLFFVYKNQSRIGQLVQNLRGRPSSSSSAAPPGMTSEHSDSSPWISSSFQAHAGSMAHRRLAQVYQHCSQADNGIQHVERATKHRHISNLYESSPARAFKLISRQFMISTDWGGAAWHTVQCLLW